jgi:hypothetical protein
MAQTLTPAFVDDYLKTHLGAHRAFGKQIRIPVHCPTPEERAWKAAIAWLEAREAARVEWPWPER